MNEKNKKLKDSIDAEATGKGKNNALRMECPLPDPMPFPVAMPSRYMKDSNYDVSQARKKFAATQMWRREHGIENMLFKKRPYFHAVRSVYPHFLNGRSKQVYTTT